MEGNHRRMTRREFTARATGALAGASILAVPGRILGLGGEQPPSDKLRIAGIGVGGRGADDMNEVSSEAIVALCDVDSRHAGGTFGRFRDAKRYADFRVMLGEVEKDIDAVVVGAPDHIHAPASMMAIRMGKHVYCEKPLTHSVFEARKVAEAAREKKVATQMGNQGQASRDTRRLSEIVGAGAIGGVREAHIWTDRPSNGLFNEYWPQGVDRPKETPPVPDGLDWNLWLGPAPARPYHPIYAPFKWRGWWDFGTGALGDIGCHAFDPVFRALKLGGAAPTSIEAASSRVNAETYPLASMITYHFPARGDLPPVKLVWYDGGLRPPRFEGLPEGEEMGANGRLLVGDKGWILGSRIYPEARRKEVGEIPASIPDSPGHHREWIAMAKGGPPAGSCFDWAGPLAEAVLLGNVALRVQLREKLTRKKLLWDPAGFKFPNCPEADEFLQRKYREGWTL